MANMTLKLAQTLTLAFVFAGCAIKSPAIYQNEIPQKVPEIKTITLLDPSETTKTSFDLVFKAKDTNPIEDNYVNTRGSQINLDKLPSIVIALPVEERTSQNNMESLNKSGAFKTEGYINKSEANVEKELIRFGFSVIDRSKFEAKLRTVRDTNNYNKKYLTNQSELYDEKIKYLKRQRDNGKLTDDEYFEKLSKADLDSQKRNKGEKEIIDMSELIRAAQMDGVKANYILQLNKIEEYSGYPTTIQIKGKEEIETYLSNNPKLEYGDNSNNIQSSFPVYVFQVIFSAKLIDVQSGKVVWTGTHELNSLDVENIKASFDITKTDISSLEMNQEIEYENSKILSLYNSAKYDSNSLEELYSKATKPRIYKDKNEQQYKEKALIKSIKSLKAQLNNKINTINEFNNLPRNIDGQVNYSYKVSELEISPKLDIDENNTSNEQEKEIKKHRERLLNKTIRSLLNTIKVKI